MTTDIRKHAAVNPFVKDNTSDWKELARQQIDENDILKQKIQSLEDLSLEDKNNEIFDISTSKCRNWKYSDRNSFELGDIEELAEDIKKNGQLQPAIVRKIEEGKFNYEIIAGERRWRACQTAELPLKAVLTSENDAGCIVIQTSENKKKSLSYFSLAKVYSRIMFDKGISQNKMAEDLGIPSTSFREILSFNKVPDRLWDVINDISLVKPRTASFIARQCEKGDDYVNAFIILADRIKQGMGVDGLEKLLNKHFSNKNIKRSATRVYHGADGKILFRMTSEGRITLSKNIVNKLDFEGFSNNLMKIIEEN